MPCYVIGDEFVSTVHIYVYSVCTWRAMWAVRIKFTSVLLNKWNVILMFNFESKW